MLYSPRYKAIALCSLFLLPMFQGCDKHSPNDQTLFTKLSSDETGIEFNNALEYNDVLNPYTRHNFFNGGGVAVGDLNNDGLPDLVFTGNLVPNRVYRNNGNFQFEDVSEKAKISSEGIWYTGVTLVDINADGLLDIYLCRTDDFLVGWRGNELYINNGDFTFKSTDKYGLLFEGYSTHGVFFDLDNDSDLDCYLMNSTTMSSVNKFYPSVENRKVNARESSKLFLNENDKFIDITAGSGVYGNRLEVGLGVTISDINQDGWQDIYVSNDFFERDYLYINNHDKTFTECLDTYIPEISMFSMGADIADINNDRYPDIYVTDMLPETEGRIKSKTNFETWEKYQYTVNSGYHHQFLRNVLQLNRGPLSQDGDTTEYYFSEIGRLGGVHASDWSWGALITDLNNDGHKDIFVSNGMAKDVTDQDFIQFMANDSVRGRREWIKIIDMIPSEKLAKSVFENNGDLTFTRRTTEWGFDVPTFSNGSAYADLDNDGDLDIITNNINDVAGVYRNNSERLLPANRWLKIAFEGEGKNKFGIGTKITAYYNNTLAFAEQFPARGYMSGSDYTVHLGLGKALQVDSLSIEWPDGRSEILKGVGTNQKITVKQKNALQKRVSRKPPVTPLLKPNKMEGLDFVHREDSLVDFNKDKLLYYMLSTVGPKAAVADVNGDGREDVYFGGSKGQSGALYLQQASGKFSQQRSPVFETDKAYEDTDCLFLDADTDGDQDLVVCSGGNAYPSGSPFLQSRLYLNNGKGIFTSGEKLPQALDENSGALCASDFDQDGDADLFVGGRARAGAYGYNCSGHLLANNGNGSFTDVTETIAPGLRNIGMITCSQWMDYDNDNKPDLVVAGEYMPVTIFHNEQHILKKVDVVHGLQHTHGWWNCLAVADLNHDGFVDIVAGNHGLNSRLKGSEREPVSLFTNDFDSNGTLEHILCTYHEGRQNPMVLRHDLLSVVPSLKKSFLKYADYKEKALSEIFKPEQLINAVRQDAYRMQTSIWLNNGKGGFEPGTLPMEAQFSPVYAIAVEDLDNDGNEDILMGGNFYEAKPEAGIHNGSYGLHLKGDGKGNFKPLPLGESGFFVKGAIRDIEVLNVNKKRFILVTRNNQPIEIFSEQRAKRDLVSH